MPTLAMAVTTRSTSAATSASSARCSRASGRGRRSCLATSRSAQRTVESASSDAPIPRSGVHRRNAAEQRPVDAARRRGPRSCGHRGVSNSDWLPPCHGGRTQVSVSDDAVLRGPEPESVSSPCSCAGKRRLLLNSVSRARLNAVNEAAFETSVEANLIEILRGRSTGLISLVADKNDSVVGHILFSRVTLAEHPQLRAINGRNDNSHEMRRDAALFFAARSCQPAIQI
jgi:hypothetical protein